MMFFTNDLFFVYNAARVLQEKIQEIEKEFFLIVQGYDNSGSNDSSKLFKNLNQRISQAVEEITCEKGLPKLKDETIARINCAVADFNKFDFCDERKKDNKDSTLKLSYLDFFGKFAFSDKVCDNTPENMISGYKPVKERLEDEKKINGFIKEIKEGCVKFIKEIVSEEKTGLFNVKELVQPILNKSDFDGTGNDVDNNDVDDTQSFRYEK